jgi:NADH-quinone oxidoreductase subunit L
MTFFGTARYDEASTGHGEHGSRGVHESPWTMLLPLVILGFLSFAGGWIGWPLALGGHDWIAHFLDPVFVGTGNVAPTAVATAADVQLDRILAAVSMLTALLGWFLADLMYRRKPQLADSAEQNAKPLYTLIWNKYWVDELYANVIVRPILALSRNLLERGVELGVIDGANTVVTAGARDASAVIRRMQSGNIRSYAGWLAAGAAAVLVVVLYLAHLY